MPRSRTTRQISLTAAFLGLAAGGLAACDSDRDRGRDEERTYYCTDRNDVIVDEDECDNSRSGGGAGFFLWYGAARGLKVGQKVPSGGNRFAATDTAARRAAGLPETGRVANGTVKTGVVGKGGSGSNSGGS